MNAALHDVLSTADVTEITSFLDGDSARVLAFGPDAAQLAQQLSSQLEPGSELLAVSTDAPVSTQGLPESVSFHQVRDDLRLSRKAVDAWLADNPVSGFDALAGLQEGLDALAADAPLVADASVDLVLSTGLRHLGDHQARERMLKELHRVTRKGGQVVIADVVSDESITSSVLTGTDGLDGSAVEREDRLFVSLAKAGLYGMSLRYRDEKAWRVVDGVELRRVVVVAYKGKEGPCWEHFQAVMYKGPFSKVEDDDGHYYERGVATAVCEKTFNLIASAPYSENFLFINPAVPVDPEQVEPFPCNLLSPVRDPSEIKQGAAARTQDITPAAAPAPAPAPKQPAIERKQVIVFERAGEGPSPSAQLVAMLRDNYSQFVTVTVADLDQDISHIRMPAQLNFRLRIMGDAALPAVVLDKVVVSIGSLPSQADVERIINDGRAFGSLAMPTLTSDSGEACGPEGCC